MVVFFFSPVVEAVCRQNKLKEAVLLPNGLLLTESDISYSSREEGFCFLLASGPRRRAVPAGVSN